MPVNDDGTLFSVVNNNGMPNSDGMPFNIVNNNGTPNNIGTPDNVGTPDTDSITSNSCTVSVFYKHTSSKTQLHLIIRITDIFFTSIRMILG